MEDSFYNFISNKRGDSSELRDCMEDVVRKLSETETGVERPGMLLGKIQGGKTRAFIGVTALAFDRGYDIAIVLTKGTKALTRQTYERIRRDFDEFIREDLVQVYDIMQLPKNFTKFELTQKLVIVVKKETNNLRRIITAVTETYPDLAKRKKVLIVDDEADYASIGFTKTRDERLLMNKIARQINDLRSKVASAHFLEVTATPYSLYLQPEDLILPTQLTAFKPVRPVFTVLVPEYPGYIGGEVYFLESEKEDSVASYIYEPIPVNELRVLQKEDRRSFDIEDSLDSDRIQVLRRALMNFVVGSCVRRIQQKTTGEREKKYSFIVHTEYSRASHAWQERVVRKVIQLLESAASDELQQQHLEKLIGESFQDLKRSLDKVEAPIPSYTDLANEVRTTLENGYVMVTRVNSDTVAEQLLDENGQLRLRTPLNVFIGGQILDRGVTIENLIGFYYGRRPQKFQQDTVLQHSRMYGNRPVSDLGVTRFYTADAIYQTMRMIDDFDSTLREALSKGMADAEVLFVRKDPGDRLVPCSPNKILLSNITTLRPYKRMLPVGFQTQPKSKIERKVGQLDALIDNCQRRGNPDDPFLIDVPSAKHIVDEIVSMLEFHESSEWDVKAVKAAIHYLSCAKGPTEDEGKIWCLVRRGRNAKRIRPSGRPFNAPDTDHVEGVIARRVATDKPMLMLFRQNGKEEDGWRGSPFWWPVLWAPKNTKPAVFATEAID